MAISQEKTTSEISVIIVNYNTNQYILDLLKQIYRPDKTLEIIVVDNSDHNTLEEKLKSYPEVKFIFNNANLGFARANNIGIKMATGEWIYLLNSDTITTSEDILKLKEVAKSNNYLVSCPRLKHRDGNVQNSIGYFDGFFKSLINYVYLRPRFVEAKNIDKNSRVDLCIFAAVLIHKSIINKIGLLDEKYYFYFEDIDYSYQLYKNEISILYVTDVVVTHFGGASADKNLQQKNINYHKGIDIYLEKNRGILIKNINSIFKFLR